MKRVNGGSRAEVRKSIRKPVADTCNRTQWLSKAGALSQRGESRVGGPATASPLHGVRIPFGPVGYEREQHLGAGGMGVVYLAEDERLHRKVALKFLPPVIANDPRARGRFTREAQSASSLDHPNIATIYEIGEWNGQPFIAMAYYEGETLRQRLARGPMDAREAAGVLADVAAGIAAAHAAGIVHRDLKPAKCIVYFPGAGDLVERSSKDPGRRWPDFIVTSGRAVMYPVYKSTFERGDRMESDIPNLTNVWRDHVIAWSKDLGRSIDYLETRSDIAHDRIAYYGLSWGAQMGAILPAVEPRLKVSVLVAGGFDLRRAAPEVDPINFAPRIRIPTLMPVH